MGRLVMKMIFLFLLAVVAPAWADDTTGSKAANSSSAKIADMPSNYEMVQAPTAYVLLHGNYDFVTQIYQDGGLFLRADVGFKNFFMMGFSANGTNLIGTGTIQIQTPKLFFKFKILDQSIAPFAWAVAWDDRGYGTFVNNRFEPGTQKGFYTVISHEYPELGYMQTHLGFNVVQFDTFDASQDLGGFGGISFAPAKPLVFNLEADKIFSSQWAFNANVMFNVEDPLRVGVDLVDINAPSLFARIIRIQYVGFF